MAAKDKDADFNRWQQSYEYLPFGSGEAETGNGSTSDLQAAHRLMEPCRKKPPSIEIEISPHSLITDDTYRSVIETWILDEYLRFARVCRELGRRLESEQPEVALDMFGSALLPGSTDLPFATHEEFTTWWEQQVEPRGAELMRLVEGMKNHLVEPAEDSEGHNRDYIQEVFEQYAEYLMFSGIAGANIAISQMEDAWNLWIKAAMVILENRLDHHKEAQTIREECLDLVRFNDDLWGDVFDRAIEKSIITLPAPAQPTPPIAVEITAEVAQVLDSKLEPLLSSMHESVQLSHALHDRLDVVVEKLIDLDQQSELSWQHIRQVTRHEPNYDEMRRSIETSLTDQLGDTWRRLEPASREDLVDAEYVFGQCDRWQRGWRMAVLGYCTTTERELKISYRDIRQRIIPVQDTEATSNDTLGDLIRALRNLKESWLSKSKPLPHASQTLLDSLNKLGRLNGIRKRATHAKEKEVSRDDAVWVREALLSGQSSALLTMIIAARPKNSSR